MARAAARVGAAGLLSALLGAPAWAQPGPRIEPEAVAPGVWLVQGVSALGSPANRNFISNAAFVVTPANLMPPST